MGNLRYRFYFERNLPHYQPPGATFFITIRLFNSLSAKLIQQYREDSERLQLLIEKIPDSAEFERMLDKEQERHFGHWDKLLDTTKTGSLWLGRPHIAGLVSKSMHFLDQKKYVLDAFCIMPNHVHLVLKPLPAEHGTEYSISAVMHSLKRYTARKANQILGKTGQFWQHESYDHVVRDDEEWKRIIRYVVNNPVSAGLVKNVEDWPWTYTRFSMADGID